MRNRHTGVRQLKCSQKCSKRSESHYSGMRSLFPKMLYQSMNLARLFSFLGKRKFAESLFCIGLARLEDPSNRVRYRKAAVCYWYADHVRREGEVLKSAIYLVTTLETLVEPTGTVVTWLHDRGQKSSRLSNRRRD